MRSSREAPDLVIVGEPKCHSWRPTLSWPSMRSRHQRVPRPKASTQPVVRPHRSEAPKRAFPAETHEDRPMPCPIGVFGIEVEGDVSAQSSNEVAVAGKQRDAGGHRLQRGRGEALQETRKNCRIGHVVHGPNSTNVHGPDVVAIMTSPLVDPVLLLVT